MTVPLDHGHRQQPDSVLWAVTQQGISINGLPPVGTHGEPVTVLRVLHYFSAPLHAIATTYRLPVALLIALIANESGAVENMATARRLEPGYVSDQVTPHLVSIGCCQTLLSTAREVLNHPDLSAAALCDPATSINAAAAYIVARAGLHHMDPPLVAADYNAGGLYREDSPKNRWKLRCFPLGSGSYIDSFVGWYNDVMRLPPDVIPG